MFKLKMLREDMTGLVKPQSYSSGKMKMALPINKASEAEQWTLDKLMTLNNERY